MADIRDGKLSDFRPLVDNPNKHTLRGTKALEGSIRDNGFVAPITVSSDGVVLDGNQRIETAADIMSDDAIVVHHDGKRPIIMMRTDVVSTDKRAFDIALRANRVAELDLAWDPEILLKYAEAVPETVEQLWSGDELTEILGEIGSQIIQQAKDDASEYEDSDQPDVEGAQEEFAVKPGDIWRVGNNFFICGDATNYTDYKDLMFAANVSSINGVLTSPPYAEQRKEDYGGMPESEYVPWWTGVQDCVRKVVTPDASFFVNIKPHVDNGQRVLYVFDMVLAMVREHGWKFVDELCWRRSTIPGKYPDRFKNFFEPVYQFARGKIKFNPYNVAVVGDKAKLSAGGSAMIGHGGKESRSQPEDFFYGDMLPSNVIEVANTEQNQHSASFAVGLADFFVKAYSNEGDVWLDPFSGSATVAIAAEKNKRQGIGIELSPKYLAYGLFRMRKLFGFEPQRVREGPA